MFNSKSNAASLTAALKRGRESGKLRLTGSEFATGIPNEVFNAETEVTGDEQWWLANPIRVLELDRCELQGPLSPAISNFKDIISLNVSHNNLTEIPDSISSLESLKLLQIAHNQISYLPQGAFPIQTLVQLQASNNHLDSIPPTLLQCPSLSELVLSHNKLSQIPPLDSLVSLVTLDLSFNQLSSLPDGGSWARLASLKSLNVSRNQLSALPPALIALEALDTLDVSFNQLSSLPEGVFDMPALKEAFASHNRLRALPEVDAAAPSLATLDVSDNQLDSLPESLGLAAALVTLNVANNNLNTLPPQLCHCPLRHIALEGNLMRASRKLIGAQTPAILTYLRSRLPEEADASSHGAGMDALMTGSAAVATAVRDASAASNHAFLLKSATLPDNVLPSEVVNNPVLHKLQVIKCQLVALPSSMQPWIGSLTELDVSFNALSGSVPDAIWSLSSLKTLNLSHNKLKAISSSGLSELTSLQSFKIAGNHGLTWIDPTPPGSAPPFVEIDVSMTGLSTVPPIILGSPSTTRVLIVSDNQLAALPEQIGEFKLLEQLDVQNNNIASLPPHLGLLGKESGGALSTLLLHGNPLRPFSLVSKPVPALLALLKNRLG